MTEQRSTAALGTERPWPGLSPFTEASASRFRGRHREVAELLRLLERDTLTLLYGRSGVGKSSLLDAGLFPRLRERDDVPVRIRLRSDAAAEPLPMQCWRAITTAFEQNEVLGTPPENVDAIWQALHDAEGDLRTPSGRVARLVLVFDQFEVILRELRHRPDLDADPLGVNAFFELLESLVVHRPPKGVATALRAPSGAARYRLLLGLREDELPAFNAFRERCRIRLENHLRLIDLDQEHAIASVLGAGGPLVNVEIARAIVAYVGGVDAAVAGKKEGEISPAILSLVCFELNERRLASRPVPPQLTVDDLKSASPSTTKGKDVEALNILDDYYRRAMNGAGMALEQYIEDRLVTPEGSRDLKPVDELVKAARGDAARVERLIDVWRVLREVPRNNARWVELSHDILVPGIVARRTNREDTRLRLERNRWRRLTALATGTAAAAVLLGASLVFQYLRAERQRGITQLLAAAGAPDATTAALMLLAGQDEEEEVDDAIPQLFAALNKPIAWFVSPASGDGGAQFSPDGKHFVATLDDRNVQVRRTDGTGIPIILRGHTDLVNAVAFSPDGRHIVSASDDSTARVWEVDGTGSSVVLRGHTSGINAAAFSPDGRLIVTASSDETARVWRVDGTAAPIVLRGHTDELRSGAFSPDGQRIVTTSDDSTARVWRADGTGAPIVLRANMASAAFSPDGRQIVTAGWDSTARVWRADGKGLPVVLKGHSNVVTSASYSTDGKRIITASFDGTARVWEADGSGASTVVAEHAGWIRSAVFSPDGRFVLTAAFDGTARLWHVDNTDISEEVIKHAEDVRSAAFSRDGQRILTSSGDGTAFVTRRDGKHKHVAFKGDSAFIPHIDWDVFKSTAFSGDGRKVLSIRLDRPRVWSTDSSVPPVELNDTAKFTSLGGVFSPDGRQIALFGVDGLARIWRTDVGGVPIVLKGHDESITAAAFSADGQKIVTASDDGAVLVRRADGTGSNISLLGHKDAVYSAAFSSDGRHIATGSTDGTARVWNADGTGVPIVLSDYNPIVRVKFSQDGRFLVTGSRSAVKVWRVNNLASPPVLLSGHSIMTNSASFSSSGERLVTTGLGDQSAMVWRVDGSGLPVVLKGHKGTVYTAAFSPDGQQVVTGSADKSVRVWPVTLAALRKRLSEITSACLDTLAGVRFLGERPAQARSRFDACERSHGRPGLTR